MWWKLIVLGVVTFAAIVSVIPIRSHVTKYDVIPDAETQQVPPRFGLSPREMIANAYVTPTTITLILIILTVAALMAWWIVVAA